MTDGRPAPRKRRPRAELRELMLQAGVEVLAEQGVELQLASVSYAKVFAHLERTKGIRITYGSVHERIWNSLQEYQLAVLERAGVWSGTSDDAQAGIDALIPSTPPRDAEDARAALTSLWRQAGTRYLEAPEVASSWVDWLQSVVAMASGDPRTLAAEASREGARATYESRLQAFRTIGGRAFDALELEANDRVPADRDVLEVLVWLAGALADGIELRSHLTDQPYPRVELRTGPDGELEEWDLYSLGMSIISDWLLRHRSEG